MKMKMKIMKNILLVMLNKMIEDGKLKFGFNENITEFVLESFEEKGDLIICKCVYIDNGKYLNKYVELKV